MTSKTTPNRPSNLDLLRHQRGEASASYAVLACAVGAVGLAGFGLLGGAFDRAIGGDANAAAASVAVTGAGRAPIAYAPSGAPLTAQAGMATTLAKVSENLGGVSRPAQELVEVLHPLLVAPEWNAAVGLRFKPPMRVLLEGAAGSGKTSLVREAAGAMDVRLIRAKAMGLIDGSSPGGTADRIRALFDEARTSADGRPAVVLIEDLDELAGINPQQFPLHLFTTPFEDEMAKLAPADRVAVVSTARDSSLLNRIAPSLSESGAFDRRIAITAPGQSELAEILGKHLRGMKLADDVSIDDLAAVMKGSYGPEISSLVQRAATGAIRRFRQLVEGGELERPAGILPESPAKRVAHVAPEVDWADAQSVGAAYAWWADTYALPAEMDGQVRQFVARLTSEGEEGEKMRAQLLAGPEASKRGFDQFVAQVVEGNLPTRASLEAAGAQKQLLREALESSESTFPLNHADFAGALRELGNEGALKRVTDSKQSPPGGNYL